MQHTITFTHQLPLLKHAMRRHCLRTFGPKSLFGAAVAFNGICALLLHYSGYNSWLSAFSAAACVIFTALGIRVYAMNMRHITKKFHDLGTPAEVTFIAEANQFSAHSKAGGMTMPWHSITELRRYADYWLLMFSKAQFITLPTEHLSEQAQTFITERITTHGGKIV